MRGLKPEKHSLIKSIVDLFPTKQAFNHLVLEDSLTGSWFDVHVTLKEAACMKSKQNPCKKEIQH